MKFFVRGRTSPCFAPCSTHRPVLPGTRPPALPVCRATAARIFRLRTKGWKDTVFVHPQGRVSLLVKFTDYAGRYLLHCHNLEHEDDGMMLNFRVSTPTGVEDEPSPASFSLHQNYPNPFTQAQPTTIDFELTERSHVSLSVFDEQGRLVLRLVDDFREAGQYSVLFNAMKLQKQPVAAGMYFAKMRVGKVEKMIKMVVRG